MSAFVFAWPAMPQPPSGASVISTQVRSARLGSPAATTTISVSSLNDAELLVAIEDVDRGEHLDADVVAVAGGVRDRISGQVMDERRCVVLEQRNVRNLFPAHDRCREVLRECVLLAPRLIARVGRRAITIGGFVQAVALASLVAITVAAWPNVSLAEITPSLAVAGFGGSFIFVSLFRLVLADVPVHLAGIGSGLMITLQQSAYALGVATLGTLFLALGDRTASGFAWVVGIQASIALVVAIGSLALPAITTPSGESLELESLPLEV
jgi:hypothetical protein